MKRISFMVLVVLVLAGCNAVTSFAGVKTINTDELLPIKNTYTYQQSPQGIAATSGAAEFYAKVKLPLGKTITKVIHYHQGITDIADTKVELFRCKMDDSGERISYTGSDYYPGYIIAVETTDIQFAKIKSDYTYYVKVYSANSSSVIRGIKIYYK